MIIVIKLVREDSQHPKRMIRDDKRACDGDKRESARARLVGDRGVGQNAGQRSLGVTGYLV